MVAEATATGGNFRSLRTRSARERGIGVAMVLPGVVLRLGCRGHAGSHLRGRVLLLGIPCRSPH